MPRVGSGRPQTASKSGGRGRADRSRPKTGRGDILVSPVCERRRGRSSDRDGRGRRPRMGEAGRDVVTTSRDTGPCSPYRHMFEPATVDHHVDGGRGRGRASAEGYVRGRCAGSRPAYDDRRCIHRAGRGRSGAVLVAAGLPPRFRRNDWPPRRRDALEGAGLTVRVPLDGGTTTRPGPLTTEPASVDQSVEEMGRRARARRSARAGEADGLPCSDPAPVVAEAQRPVPDADNTEAERQPESGQPGGAAGRAAGYVPADLLRSATGHAHPVAAGTAGPDAPAVGTSPTSPTRGRRPTVAGPATGGASLRSNVATVTIPAVAAW